MLRGWVELFDRFIESLTQRYGSRDRAAFEVARHACGMVCLLLVVIIVICFQAVMANYDYITLKEDYTQLNVEYLKHGNVFVDMGDRLARLENFSSDLRKDNLVLLDRVGDLYKENVNLKDALLECENPDYQSKPK